MSESASSNSVSDQEEQPQNLKIDTGVNQNIDLQEEEEGDDSLNNWYELRLKGKLPDRRGYHSTFVWNSKLFIYGGNDIKEGSLWMLDLSTMTDLDKPESI